MLLLAAFSLLGVFRLAQRVANMKSRWAATVCTALYPVFFTQSSLAHLDLAAAGLTFWGLRSYVDERLTATAFWFSTGGAGQGNRDPGSSGFVSMGVPLSC